MHVTALCPGYVHTEFHERGNVSTSKIPDFLWVPAESTVRTALRDSARGKVVSIPSVRYKVLIGLARHAPQSWLRSVSAQVRLRPRDPARAAAADTQDHTEITRMTPAIKTNRFTSPGMASMRFIAQRGLLKPLVWRLTKVTVVGIENAKKTDAPFIAVANHSSHLDAPLILGALPRNKARYLAAGAAADYFFDVKWRKWLTALFFNAFPVDRGTSRTSPGMSKKLLDHNVPLLIFPEGGRSKDGAMGKFKAGAGRAFDRHEHRVPPRLLWSGRASRCPAGATGPSRAAAP